MAGRHVLDLGCGSGLVAIAAAKAGAARVGAADVDPYAVAACRLNAAANAVDVEAVCADLLAGGPPDAGVILVGDLFYDPALAERVTAFLDRCAGAGREVLIGDPWRTHLQPQRLTLLTEYPVREGAAHRLAGVFTFA